MDEQNRNLILATVLSALVILVWMTFFPPEQPVPPAGQETAGTSLPASSGETTAPAPSANASKPSSAAPALADQPEVSRAEALARTARIAIDTPRLTGSISLRGGRIDDLALKDYHENLEPESPLVTLLSPVGAPKPYYALYGWAPAGNLDFADVPGATTEWAVETGEKLTVHTPVTLIWDNGKGLTFRKRISVDDNFLFSIEQSVTNYGDTAYQVQPYGIIARHGKPDTIGFYILHEGVVRASDGKIEEIKYKDMPDGDALEGAAIDLVAVKKNGWIGFTDKYWMTTLIGPPGQGFQSVSKYTEGSEIYQTDMRLPALSVAPRETQSAASSLFAGAKEWDAIQAYQNKGHIDKFIDSIDWGMFFFLTKPIFWVLHSMNKLIGNMGIAIISLTIIIKALLFPLAYKSYVSMARMKELQPEIEKMKERLGDDRQAMQQEMMRLYKEKKANPAAGCLPILPQIPIFFSLYKVIFVTIELRHAPFFGWIRDLSAPDPTSVLNLFGLLPFDPPDPSSVLAILSIGVFPILMGISMWMQQKLNPAPTDRTQAQIFAWMPWVFMFMLGRFASGLVIYWVANNTITFTQQYLIMRSQGVKPGVFGNIISGFRRGERKKE